ncbi:MAG: endopolygalacturonase [Clostridia bacterium]|nr:endopolygalacturonase [Clostridia bacterium]
MKVSVWDFGARGDGVRDDYAAFQAALDSGAEEIVIPAGVYPISETLRVASHTAILADRGAKIVMQSATRRQRNQFLLSNKDVTTGNADIRIVGGVWDGNSGAPENAKSDLFDENGYSGVLLNFVNVEGLTLRDMVLANSVTYYVRLCRVHRFAIENIDFVCDRFGANQDGLHFGGDVRHGTVKNIRALSYGQTNDDMVALNADDCIERVENRDLCRNVIEDITFENIYTENCHTIIRMLSVTAPIRHIRFKNVYGGFRCYAVNADGARYCRTPLFKEEEYPAGIGPIEDIVCENFTCRPIVEPPSGFGGTPAVPGTAMALESQMDGVVFTDFRYLCPPDDRKRCPVAVVRNVVGLNLDADGQAYTLENKADTLRLEDFHTLCIRRR